MILHANAALSRGSASAWSALVAAGHDHRGGAARWLLAADGLEWVGRAGAARGSLIAPSRPHRSPRRTPAVVSRRSCGRAGSAARPAPARLGARSGRLDRARDPAPSRCSRLRPSGPAGRSSATSASAPASSSTSTQEAGPHRRARAIASPATAATAPVAPAGSTCSSRSTTLADSASPASTPTRAPTRRSPSSTP